MTSIDQSDEALRAQMQAQQAFDRGEYDKAVRIARRAWRLAPLPSIAALQQRAQEAIRSRPQQYCSGCYHARWECHCGPSDRATAPAPSPPAGTVSFAQSWDVLEGYATAALGPMVRPWAPARRVGLYAALLGIMALLAAVRLLIGVPLWRILSYGDLSYSGTLGGGSSAGGSSAGGGGGPTSTFYVGVPVLTPMLLMLLVNTVGRAFQR